MRTSLQQEVGVTSEMLKPRVFISCGQREGASEREIASRVREIVEQLGFEPYVAFQHQSLEGFKEGVVSKLRRSEYFLFIDFPREKIESGECRGSLFSHQELAIAAELELDVAIFQQKGLERNGILNYVMETRRRSPTKDNFSRQLRRKWFYGQRVGGTSYCCSVHRLRKLLTPS